MLSFITHSASKSLNAGLKNNKGWLTPFMSDPTLHRSDLCERIAPHDLTIKYHLKYKVLSVHS